MTAQIVVMNKKAIALASDSATTICNGSETDPIKIIRSSNKLFALSKRNPVGLMAYDNSELMDVPIETIINIYGKHLDKRTFDTLGEYVDDFIEFLENGNNLLPEIIKKNYTEEQIYGYYEFIKNRIDAEIIEIEKSGRKMNSRARRKVVTDIISQLLEETSKDGEKVPGILKSHTALIKKQYADLMHKAMMNVFEGLPLTKDDFRQIKDRTPYILCHYFDSIGEGEEFCKDSTSVVFAGFGEKDIFPRLKTIDINGIISNKLIYITSEPEKIEETSGGQIATFAQGDMACTFMNGIAPDMRDFMLSELEAVLDRLAEKTVHDLDKYSVKEKKSLREQFERRLTRALNDYEKHVKKWSRENISDDILTIVRQLPPCELASMAETLVNLTSFKGRVTADPETVSEPIDVAVISKSDGFIWIKRKSYFSPECN